MLVSIFMLLKKPIPFEGNIESLSLELLLEPVAVSTLLHCSLIW